MKKNRIHFTFLLFAAFLLGIGSCKTSDPWENPYDNPDLQPPVDTGQTYVPDPASFVGLHNNIFAPTCANSGCHDGTFEPDFRTIESAYNTLVLKEPIKNSIDSAYDYRVEPGNADFSVLYKRLTIDIDGQSGLMPLAVEPNSDWEEKKTQYIQNVKDWINGGAKDMFGNLPTAGDVQPQLQGIVAFADGSLTKVPRSQSGQGILKVPSSAQNLEIWFSFFDPETAIQDLAYNKVKFSLEIDKFSNLPENDLTFVTTPITEKGYFGTQVQYYHKVSFNVNSFAEGAIIFIRAYVEDATGHITEIPNLGSPDYIKEYCAIKIVN
ncbi:MAG: hypothetical protein H6581_28665 [Bacteroidia bacterium]|nr:hypothetical protein [Bacteroidia bacterium]